MPGCNVQDLLGYEERIEPRSAIAAKELAHLLYKGYHATDAGGPDDTYAVLVDPLFGKIGAVHRFRSGYQGYLRKTVQFTGFLAVKEILRVEVL